MRGIVYRLGRRRTGSVAVAMAMAFTLATGSAASSAKALGGAHPPVKAPAVWAHATGHKIA
jgi:hypothetical protein